MYIRSLKIFNTSLNIQIPDDFEEASERCTGIIQKKYIIRISDRVSQCRYATNVWILYKDVKRVFVLILSLNYESLPLPLCKLNVFVSECGQFSDVI